MYTAKDEDAPRGTILMDTEHGQSAPHDAADRFPQATMPTAPPPPPPPPPGWTGSYGAGWNAAGQAGPGYVPPGYGYGPAGPGYPGAGWETHPPKPPRRRGIVLAAAATALALAAGGAAWAAAGHSASPMTATQIASKTNPGVVDITSTLGFSRATAEGTGMVLTPNGEVLTNNHVIEGATSISVRDVGNDHTYKAKVVGYSNSNDVAVLQLQGASGLQTVSIGSSARLAPGQPVVALGNAQGRGGIPSVATGRVTGLGAMITAQNEGSGTFEHLSGMIRTNAPIQPGDSGGPLVNAAGKVIGMDTAASSAGSGPGTTAAMATQAFAIPIDKAIQLADQIEAGTSSSTVHIGASAFLGVAISSQSQQGGFGQALRGNKALNGALSAITAAVVGVVLNLLGQRGRPAKCRPDEGGMNMRF